MPRYDYRCEAGHKFELQLPFGSSSEQPCARCGKPAHRQMVAPTVVFKAGGFYKTSGRDSDSGSASSSSSKSSSKTPPVETESPSTSHTPTTTPEG